ncbi:MAG: hypothetical protein RIM99_13590 [Cyclobacteriaceae bacterium]
MNDKNSSTRLLPFSWPWRGVDNSKVSLRQALLSRKFSILYLLVIWGIVGALDFASTRNCTGTWQLALQCEYAFWVSNLTNAPFLFLRNVFTCMLLHNGLDHILFVTILGFLVIVQSYEVRFGFKETALMFLLAYFVVGFIFGVFYQGGLSIWPENEFFQFAYERSWMGGSLGFFFILGAISNSSRKPYVMLSFPFIFEGFNFFVLDIDFHISLMHLVSATCGFFIKRNLVSRYYRTLSTQ